MKKMELSLFTSFIERVGEADSGLGDSSSSPTTGSEFSAS